MKSLKIYDRDNKVIFYKNNDMYFVYKYEKGKEIKYIFSKTRKTKFQSVFDYIEKGENYKLNFSLTSNHLEYEIIKLTECGSTETEKGRIPIDSRKKEWSKKILKTTNGDIIGIEDFNDNRSVIYKVKEEIINKIINK